jgi:hypothetical protein
MANTAGYRFSNLYFGYFKGMEKAFTQPIHYFTLPTFFTTRQYESMAFDRDGNLWIAAEKTAFLKPILKKVKIPRRFSLVRSR